MSILQRMGLNLNIGSDEIEVVNPPEPPRVCPKCHGKLIKWGSYQREVTLEEHLGRVFKTRVRRMRCRKCGVTHAVLPHFLAPHQHFATSVRQKLVEKWALGPRCGAWPPNFTAVWTRCAAG